MSDTHKTYVEFPGRILFIGFGSIGQGTLPLVLRHIGIAPERITIVTAEDRGRLEAEQYGIKFVQERLTRETYRRVLNPLLGRGDFVINVSVEVSSLALIKLCWEKGAMYLDTCIEPWPGGYTDPTMPASKRTNYAMREEALALRVGNPRAPTAVLTHGANPGLVSHFVKQALLNIAVDSQLAASTPTTRGEWGELARRLGVKVVHAAERDGLGDARAQLPARWQAPRFRLPRGDLSDAARRGDARAHLDAARRTFSWLLHHARGGDLDRRLFHCARWRAGCLPPDRALRLSPLRFGDRLGVRTGGAQLRAAGTPAHPHGRHHLRDRRTRCAARRPQEECLLVRFAAVDRRGAPARALQQCHQPAGVRRGARRRRVGDGKPQPRGRRARRDGLPPLPGNLP